MDDQILKWSSGTHDLFSIIVTLWSLILLYLPRCLFIFSPVLIAAIALFLILLRCETAQRIESEPHTRAEDHHLEETMVKTDDGICSKSELKYRVEDLNSFLEWDVRAPLEVIYEEESETEDAETTKYWLRRQTSLSRYFPETDSDTSSSDEYPDWDSSGKNCFKWDEDDWNGLIEISLDGKKASDFEPEDNMIEIDISPANSSQIPTS